MLAKPHFKLLMIEFTTGVAFLLSSMYGAGASTAVAIATPQSSTDNPSNMIVKIVLQDRKAVEEYLRKEYADTPILVEIARCESTFSQFDKKLPPVNGDGFKERVIEAYQNSEVTDRDVFAFLKGDSDTFLKRDP